MCEMIDKVIAYCLLVNPLKVWPSLSIRERE